MNLIIIKNSKEEIIDTDAIEFYKIISQGTGTTLDPKKDRIVIFPPEEQTRNSKQNHLIYCLINTDRKIALKRCSDMKEFLRAELIIDQAKRIINLPHYTIFQIDGIVLRNKKTKKNCNLLKGWEKRSFLVIDYGNPKLLKPIKELKKEEIHVRTFFYSYGEWAAFNLIFGVRDRHAANFVLCINDNTLQSVDNEEIFFDHSGKLVPARVIIVQTNNSVRGFVDEENGYMCTENFRKGFVECWKKIVANLSCFTMFNGNELEIIHGTIKIEPENVVPQFLV